MARRFNRISACNSSHGIESRNFSARTFFALSPLVLALRLPICMPPSTRKLFDCTALEPAALHKIFTSSFQRGKCAVRYAKSRGSNQHSFGVYACRRFALPLCFSVSARSTVELTGFATHRPCPTRLKRVSCSKIFVRHRRPTI